MKYWDSDNYDNTDELSSMTNERSEYMKIVDSSLRLGKDAYHKAIDQFKEIL